MSQVWQYVKERDVPRGYFMLLGQSALVHPYIGCFVPFQSGMPFKETTQNELISAMSKKPLHAALPTA